MAQTLDEAKQSAGAAVIEDATNFILNGVRLDQFRMATMLYVAFTNTGRPNAAAMLAPIFLFVANVQAAARPTLLAIAAATTVEDVWTARAALDLSGVTVPTGDLWLANFPAN